MNNFFVLAAEQQRSEVNLSNVEEYIWFDNTSHYEEVLNNFLRRYGELPVGFVCAECFRRVFKDNFGLLPAEDDSARRDAFEESFMRDVCTCRDLVFFKSSPFVFVADRSRVDDVESSRVLGLRAERLKVHNVVGWI